MLEVVEHEQEPAVTQVTGKRFADVIAGSRGRRGSAPLSARRGRDRPAARDRRRRRRREILEELRPRLSAQSRFAGASGSRQGHEPGLGAAEERRQFADLALSADERGRLRAGGSSGVFGGARRRELAVQVRHDELEQPLSRGEVGQPVPPRSSTSVLSRVVSRRRSASSAREGSVQGARRPRCSPHRGRPALCTRRPSRSPRPS